jgi:hypothetical protein
MLKDFIELEYTINELKEENSMLKQLVELKEEIIEIQSNTINILNKTNSIQETHINILSKKKEGFFSKWFKTRDYGLTEGKEKSNRKVVRDTYPPPPPPPPMDRTGDELFPPPRDPFPTEYE